MVELVYAAKHNVATVFQLYCRGVVNRTHFDPKLRSKIGCGKDRIAGVTD
jgi:hypothetical protein